MRDPAKTFRHVGQITCNIPSSRGEIGENAAVICLTAQAVHPAADWHDGQFAHGAYARIARRRATQDRDGVIPTRPTRRNIAQLIGLAESVSDMIGGLRFTAAS
jgi:hypothetical protein